MEIPKGELARRLCLQAHTRLQSTVPCGTHVAEAERYYALITARGTGAMQVLLQARRDGKVE